MHERDREKETEREWTSGSKPTGASPEEVVWVSPRYEWLPAAVES